MPTGFRPLGQLTIHRCDKGGDGGDVIAFLAFLRWDYTFAAFLTAAGSYF